MKNETYSRLISLLDEHHANYRLIDHEPEGRTEIVSPMRGNKLSQAAKCMVLTVNIGKKETKYVLGVIPGDKQIDFNAVRMLMQASYVSFTPQELTEELAQSVVGTILPFSFNPKLELIVDPLLLDNDEIFFNAARLDRSIALKTKDYLRIVKPRLEDIAKTSSPQKNKPLDEISNSNLRHSCAHLLAAAVMDLWPKTKRTIGPSIENGFYYDFDFSDVKISEKDFSKIEQKMHELVKNWKEFKQQEVSHDEAIKKFYSNKYKKELIEEFSKEGQTLTLYQSGDYIDLCRGGHCEHPDAELKHFKLLSMAGAYWRGSEKNKMLTRIYGTAFPNNKELENYLWQLEEAKKRDHRKLGQELDLYSTNPLTGQGLILWHPKLATVRNIVENFWKEEHQKNGYQFVYTPHIASMDMFVISRHYIKYIDFMFPVMLHQYIEGESAPDYIIDEQLKPMNCPNHIQIYKTKPRSYRDLPFRMAELGTVYRYERAGVLHGMTRVRGFTQDDTHIFCRPEQVIDEVKGILRLTKHIYETFGFKDYQAYLATRPEKYLGDKKVWQETEEALKKALEEEKINYKVDEAQGAFYGPKIDSKIKDSLGREWQLGTIQVDFNMPSRAETTKEEIEDFWNMKTFKQKFKTKENLTKYLKKLGRGFDVRYINKDGKEEQAIMIHRTILGSMERFFGVLIEHYAGAFPVWLAPVQVMVIPISEKYLDYAQKVKATLLAQNIRVELDNGNDTMQGKIRAATLQKVPYMIILGEKEVKNNNLSIRTRKGLDLRDQEIEKFTDQIVREIKSKSFTV